MSDQLARQALALLSHEHPRGLPQRREPRGALADAARFDAGRHGLRQRAGRGRACARLSDRRDLPRAARPVERARADGRAALQPAGRRGALCANSRPSSIPGSRIFLSREAASRVRGGASPPSAATASVPASLAEVGVREERSRTARRGRDEADAPAREQPARGDLRGCVRDLQRGARRQAAAGRRRNDRSVGRRSGGTDT